MGQQVHDGYRLLDHVTDALIEAWGTTFEGALVQAALGLLDTMVDTKKVKPVLEETILVEGHDELELVYNWLEQLLLSFEIKEQVLAHFQISPVESTGKALHFTAKARGEKYDPAVHGGRVEVKGITYHLMEVQREPSLVRVRYLLDL
jgi:protein archease